MHLITGDAMKEYIEKHGKILDGDFLCFKCTASFFTTNKSGTLNRKINMCSMWLDLGVENHARKLKRIDRKMDDPYIYIDKDLIKKYFKVEGIAIPEREY